MTAAMGLSSFLLAFFESFFVILVVRIEHCRASVSLLPILVLVGPERRYQFSYMLLAIHDLVW